MNENGASTPTHRNLQQRLVRYRHENVIVKTELAYLKSAHEKEIKEIKSIHKEKIQSALQVIDELKGSDREGEAEVLQKEVIFLNQQIQLLQNDLSRMKNTLEEAENIHEEQLTVLRNDMAGCNIALVTCEKEKELIKQRKNELERSLEDEIAARRKAEQSLNEELLQIDVLKRSFEELEDQCKHQILSAKAEVEKYKSQISYQEESYKCELEEFRKALNAQTTSDRQTTGQNSQNLRDAEKAHSEESQKLLDRCQQLLFENANLVQSVQQHEYKLSNLEKQHSEKLNELYRNLQLVTKDFTCAQLEIEKLQTNLEESYKLQVTLKETVAEKKKDEFTIKGQRKEIEMKIKQIQALQEKLHEEQNIIAKLRIELHTTAESKEAVELQHQASISKLRNKESLKLSRVNERVKFLENSMKEKTAHHAKDMKKLKKKARTYARLIKKLRRKLDVLNTCNEQLEAKAVALKETTVPADSHRHLLKQLQIICSKHSNFKAVLDEFSRKQRRDSQLVEFDKSFQVLNRQLSQLDIINQTS